MKPTRLVLLASFVWFASLSARAELASPVTFKGPSARRLYGALKGVQAVPAAIGKGNVKDALAVSCLRYFRGPRYQLNHRCTISDRIQPGVEIVLHDIRREGGAGEWARRDGGTELFEALTELTETVQGGNPPNQLRAAAVVCQELADDADTVVCTMTPL